jgi:hypothetical protein
MGIWRRGNLYDSLVNETVAAVKHLLAGQAPIRKVYDPVVIEKNLLERLLEACDQQARMLKDYDRAAVDVDKLLAVFLDYDAHPWRRDAEIIEKWLPEHPRPDTKPRCVVRWGNSFLRHSHGPLQHHFWDIGGDDYQTRVLALLALSQAPPHPRLMYLGIEGCKKDWQEEDERRQR